MNSILDTVLMWAERQLPDSRRIWISDLRAEAKHISGKFARQRFLWSGAMAAVGQVLRIRIGVQRIGQMLLGFALLSLCFYGGIFALGIEDNVVRTAVYCVFPLYAVTGALALLDLRLMKHFTLFCSWIFTGIWMVSGLEVFTSLDAPIVFLRALALEVSFMMVGLFIIASYLGWVGDADPA